MCAAPDAPGAREAARAWIDSDSGMELPAAAEARLALAWALKDLCHEAWNSQPQRAVAAAEKVRSLSDAAVGTDSTVTEEIGALASWTDGLAHIARGRMVEALVSLDRAADAFRVLGRAGDAAQTQVPKVMALSMLGRYNEAAACGERTWREFMAQGDARSAGKVSLNLGSLHLRLDAYPPAALCYRKAAVLFARARNAATLVRLAQLSEQNRRCALRETST